MNNTEIFDKVNTILKTAQGNILDICYALYCECISQSDSPHEVLQQILQYESPVGTKDAPSEKIKDEVKNRISISYYNLLHDIVQLLMGENTPVNEFYQKLYEQIFSLNIFPRGDVERAVILWLLIDNMPEFPYYQAVNLLKKSDAEYREALNRLRPHLNQAVHMLNRHFGSRTEETSQLVRIASEIRDESDQIIYWSALISLFKDSSNEREK